MGTDAEGVQAVLETEKALVLLSVVLAGRAKQAVSPALWELQGLALV